MPSATPAVSRRSVLLGAAALAVLGAGATACGTKPPPPEIDDLKSQLDLARRDSDMARAAATAADNFYAPPLTVVAAERAAHAKALTEEIARAAGTPTSTTETTSPSSTSPAPAAAPPSLLDVTTALRGSADSANQLIAKLSGYRAGLVGSIAASCMAAVTVPLAMKEPTT